MIAGRAWVFGDDIDTDVKPPSVKLLRESVDAAETEAGSRTYQSVYSLRGYPFSDIRQPGQFWQGGPYGWALRTLAMQVTSGGTAFVPSFDDKPSGL